MDGRQQVTEEAGTAVQPVSTPRTLAHFAHLDEETSARLFQAAPQPFAASGDVQDLALALGATLYMPATRPALAEDLLRARRRGVVSVVVCLEDAVADGDVEAAEQNLVEQLARLASPTAPDLPVIFVRVRRAEQIVDLAERLGGAASLLTGFVLPKFDAVSGSRYFAAVRQAEQRYGLDLLVMPVIETPGVIHLETRRRQLIAIKRVLEANRPRVLAVRVGATDLCSVFGIRRHPDLTIWDVGVVAALLTDVVNLLGRADGTGFSITGPVWEYFSSAERLFKPQLRESPFVAHRARELRHEMVRNDLDGLIREVVLDRANGLTGKTVIHPEHVAVVHALSVVSAEEFADASDIAAVDGGGVAASRYGNKMNEAKPHRAWAERTLRAARIFGVVHEGVGLVDLLTAQSAH